MKRIIWLGIFAVSTATFGQENVSQSLGILDEKLTRLSAQYEDLQFKQQKLQQQLDDLQTQMLNLRSSSGAVSANDLQALEAKIKALDAARERDKQVILDTLAKELSAAGGSKPTPATRAQTSSAVSAAPDAKEHVVQKGETLAAIAKLYGVTVADLAKANNLSNPNELKAGQKLVIPK
jgi:LysM repeat protein